MARGQHHVHGERWKGHVVTVLLQCGGNFLLPQGSRGGQREKDLPRSRCRHVYRVNLVN